MKKLSVCLFVLTAFILLVSCGGGGGGATGSSSDGSSPAAGGVYYAPGYTYYVADHIPDPSKVYDLYPIRQSLGGNAPLQYPGATGLSSVATSCSEPEQNFAQKRFPQNTDEWPVPEVGLVTRNRVLASIQPNTYNVGDTETFWVITNFNSGSGITKEFKLKVIGTHCRVWYDVSNPNNLTDTQLGNIQTRLDAMFAVETALCGSMVPTSNNWSNIISINSNTKLEIVIYEMEHTNTGALCGYFSPNDFTTNGANSNKAPIIYISSYNISPETYSTVSHEFDHLLNYINKTINRNLSMETWYTELLSNTIEEVLENFNGASAATYSNRKWLPVFLCSYNKGLLWNQDDASYSNVYAFGAWLVRNYGGAQLFKEIATNAYVNEESIVRAVNTINSGANETFASLRLKFAESLIFMDENCGKPNFNKRIYDTTFFSGVTIDMPKINLSEKLTLNSASANYAQGLVGCTEGQPYYGPLILKPGVHFSTILRYGFEIQMVGDTEQVHQIQIPSEAYGKTYVEFKEQ